jgi:glycosyltransferase involved in cell wall biosynthesis
MPDCIVVIPCFNEAQRLDLPAFVEHAVRGECDLLLVNDGSTDATGSILDDLCAANPASLSVLHLPQNRGKAEAVRQGLLVAFRRRPTFVGYWDADLATPLAAITEFRDYLRAHPVVEIVLGARVRLLGRSIERRASRHCAGRAFATAASWVLNLPVYDTQCGAKLFRNTERTRSLFAVPFGSRWIFDVELLARYLTSAAGSGQFPADLIHELPLQTWHDIAGSKVRPRDFLRAAIELAGIARRYPELRTPRQTASAPLHHTDAATRPEYPPAAAPHSSRITSGTSPTEPVA